MTLLPLCACHKMYSTEPCLPGAIVLTFAQDICETQIIASLPGTFILFLSPPPPPPHTHTPLSIYLCLSHSLSLSLSLSLCLFLNVFPFIEAPTSLLPIPPLYYKYISLLSFFQFSYYINLPIHLLIFPSIASPPLCLISSLFLSMNCRLTVVSSLLPSVSTDRRREIGVQCNCFTACMIVYIRYR